MQGSFREQARRRIGRVAHSPSCACHPLRAMPSLEGLVPEDQIRLADLLAALSVSTDLAMGQPSEKAIRACVVATEIARHMDLREPDVADAYYTTMLKHLGCTATSHEELHLFGPDEAGMRSLAERTDVTSARDMFSLIGIAGRRAGAGRIRYVARAVAGGKSASESIMRSVCDVAARMAERLGMTEAVRRGLAENLERWDGKGAPQKLRGEDISLPSRIAEPATQAVIFHRLGGTEAALAMVERRAGTWFDPAVAEAFAAVGSKTLERLDHEDPWAAVLDAEPAPVRRVAPDALDRVAEAFADMVDLKTPYTLGHSEGVAAVSAAAAELLGMPEPVSVRRAALFHDLGRVAIPTVVWEKPSSLTTAEWEQVRLHPYQTERILARSSLLAPVARIAGMHHERQDGSGYHHGAAGAQVPVEARVVAAADAYQAMTQERPHRAALTSEAAAELVMAEANARRFDLECARAVVEAAGQRPPRARTGWPAGLSDREVEVLRLLARGLSNRAIAVDLFISPRTVDHHVEHIYGKIGVSTRAGAALFSMEHGLLKE
jgi:HD-GYP domain-containing protein (c-di-GMP phosphodiesterase class II)